MNPYQIEYNRQQWQERDEEFCPKYPTLTEDKEGRYMAIIMHNVTFAKCAIYATNLTDLNKLIAYFVRSHKDTRDKLYIAGYEDGKLLYCEDIVVTKEKPAPETVKPLNTHDYRDVMAILREAGNKQFCSIIAYLSRGAQHVLQTVTNGYLIAEVSITGEVTPIMQFKSKRALHKYFGI
jgi:hypothetical protein